MWSKLILFHDFHTFHVFQNQVFKFLGIFGFFFLKLWVWVFNIVDYIVMHCILSTFKLILMHFIQVVCLIMLSTVVWIGFYSRCNFFYTTHVHAFPCIVLLLSLTLLSMCISLSTLVYLTMAPKAQKSVPSKNPISRFAYTSSSIPPQLQFCDSNSHKEFEEKFSGWAIHSDCQVILSNFSDTMVSRSFISRGWEFLCERPVTYPSMFIKEFYFNI